MECSADVLPVMKAFDFEAKKLYLYMVRCKSWYCPNCGHVNKLQWIAKISNGIDQYYENDIDKWMFCTVTSHRVLKNRSQCLWVEPKAWKKLWSRIHYHHGNVRYVYIPELHKNGRVHWHFIMSGGIPVKWWKKHATKSGFGYMVDSQPVRDGYNSVLYVTKELSKSLAISTWPRNLRRIRTSQQWPQMPTGDDFTALKLDWVFLSHVEQKNIESLREEVELESGIETVLIKQK